MVNDGFPDISVGYETIRCLRVLSWSRTSAYPYDNVIRILECMGDFVPTTSRQFDPYLTGIGITVLLPGTARFAGAVMYGSRISSSSG